MYNTLEKIIDDGINLFFDIIKELIEYYTPNVDLNDIKDKSIYMERMAKFGWTNWYDIMDIYGENEFNEQEDIDNYLFKKFTENDKDLVLDVYIDLISTYPKVESELNEAKQCYKNEEFRGCAMIITSLIDKIFILFQKENIHDGKRIKTGMGATNIIKSKIENFDVRNTSEEMYLSIISILGFFKVFFEDTNNFENNKNVINRNFLMHGMWTKDVTKIDCMKLFIALFNTIVTIDMYLSIIQ